jgi:hypothetical protein
MHTILLSQLRHHHFFTDRFKRNQGLEIGRMVLSFGCFGSSLSQVEPP